jgi:hypothetical protein
LFAAARANIDQLQKLGRNTGQACALIQAELAHILEQEGAIAAIKASVAFAPPDQNNFAL